MAYEQQKLARREAVIEYFKRMLGRGGGAIEKLSETQKADMEQIISSVALPAHDPFWALIAFFYARVPNDIADYERLNKTIESLGKFESLLDSKLTSFSGDVENLAKRIPEITKAGLQEVLQEVLKNGSPGGATIDAVALDALHAKIKADIEGIANGQVVKPTIRGWLGDRWHHVMYGFGGVLGLLVISVLGAYWIGSAAGEATGKAAAIQQTSATQKFISTIPADDRRHLLDWIVLNRGQLSAITSCDVTGWLKKDDNGSIACYPQGGHGFYAVPTQGLMGKAAEVVRGYLP